MNTDVIHNLLISYLENHLFPTTTHQLKNEKEFKTPKGMKSLAENIEKLKDENTKKDKEIKFLKSQIKALNQSFFRRDYT